jgi:hypothetical protein
MHLAKSEWNMRQVPDKIMNLIRNICEELPVGWDLTV